MLVAYFDLLERILPVVIVMVVVVVVGMMMVPVCDLRGAGAGPSSRPWHAIYRHDYATGSRVGIATAWWGRLFWGASTGGRHCFSNFKAGQGLVASLVDDFSKQGTDG